MTPALWFFDHGIHVFPTVNKVPAVPKGTSQFDYSCSREQAARFREYGVPLGRLMVVDTDNAAAEAWVATNVPATPFTVRTKRGTHRYFRTAGPLPQFIHRDGHTIECRNVGQYVVGPGSVRPDGVVYRASDWSWRWEDIPIFPSAFDFDDRSPEARGSNDGEPYEFPEVVCAGERHDQLFRLLRSCKGNGWDRETARDVVHLANQARCQPPLVEDSTFARWFDRAWTLPDRSLAPLSGLRGVRGL